MTDAPAKGLVFVLSGPSGVGKDTVLDALVRRAFPFGRVVTAVTREPRPSEVEGIDYHFLPAEEFLRLADAGEFLEWTEYVGSPRGTPLFALRETLARGHDAVLKIDVEGFRKVRRRLPNAIGMFLAPPSFEALESRIRARQDTPPDEMARRLERARHEMLAMPEFDYRVVNNENEVERAADEIAAIMLAERARIEPRLTEV
jgi:guanylate kinase